MSSRRPNELEMLGQVLYSVSLFLMSSLIEFEEEGRLRETVYIILAHGVLEVYSECKERETVVDVFE